MCCTVSMYVYYYYWKKERERKVQYLYKCENEFERDKKSDSLVRQSNNAHRKYIIFSVLP